MYPHRTKVTGFSLYEDDGLTREYKTNKFARTLITCDGTQANNKRYVVAIGAANGEYNGKPAAKTYIVTIHTGTIWPNIKPTGVKIDGVSVPEKADSASLEACSEGWWWNTIKNGIAYVKTQPVSTNNQVTITIDEGMGINKVTDKTGKEVLNNFSVVCNGGKVRIAFTKMFTGRMNASIYTLQGKLVVHKAIDVAQSKAELWNTDPKAVSGSYILRLEYKGRTVSRKFVVGK